MAVFDRYEFRRLSLPLQSPFFLIYFAFCLGWGTLGSCTLVGGCSFVAYTCTPYYSFIEMVHVDDFSYSCMSMVRTFGFKRSFFGIADPLDRILYWFFIVLTYSLGYSGLYSLYYWK